MYRYQRYREKPARFCPQDKSEIWGSLHKKLLSGLLGRQVDHRQLGEGAMLCPGGLWDAGSQGRWRAERFFS